MEAIKVSSEHVVESDFIDKKTNKRCLVVFNRMGIRCGYVEKHKELQKKKYINNDSLKVLKYENDNVALNAMVLAQRRQEMDYNTLDIDYIVHGGITFEGEMINSERTKTSVLGFDFGHLSDKHDIKAYKKYFGSNESMLKAFLQEDALYTFGGRNKKVATVKDVEIECIEIAKQMMQAENIYLRKEREEKTKKWKYSNKKEKRWKQRKER